jgi:hypothetical protein
MADKILRIIFNGISTLSPGPPREGDEPPVPPWIAEKPPGPPRKRGEPPVPPWIVEKPPSKAFVMMAANVPGVSAKGGTESKVQKTGEEPAKQINDWGAAIPDHFPFVQIRRSLLIDPPDPSESVLVSEGSEHFIYYFKDARVRIDPPSTLGTRVDYFTDPKRPLAERPGSNNVAPPSDIRWLADLRDILSEPAPFRNPDEPLGEEVAAVVNLDSGLLKANFPCASVAPKTFMTFTDGEKGKVVPGLRRVLADEFIIDIPYSEDTDRITLKFQRLREGTPVQFPQLKDGTRVEQPNELVIDWPKQQELLVVRMGNDTKDEVRRLDTPERCDPVRLTGPVLKARDDDFDLHYNLLEIPKGVGRPLPQNDIQQCSADGCKPATGG